MPALEQNRSIGPKRAIRRRDEVLHLLLVAHVARDRLGAPAAVGDAVRGGACAAGDHIGDRDRSSVGREPLAQRTPDSRPAPRDDGVLPVQFHSQTLMSMSVARGGESSGASRDARQRTSVREPGILARSERAKEQVMSTMRFNHMELTFPKGTFTDDFRADLESFYGGVLGWNVMATQVLKMDTYLLQPDDGQFILLAEADKHLESPGLDHLGLLMESREEVDEMLERCQRFQEKDDRLKILHVQRPDHRQRHRARVLREAPAADLVRHPDHRARGRQRGPGEALGVRVAPFAPSKTGCIVALRGSLPRVSFSAAPSAPICLERAVRGWDGSMHSLGFRRAVAGAALAVAIAGASFSAVLFSGE